MEGRTCFGSQGSLGTLQPGGKENGGHIERMGGRAINFATKGGKLFQWEKKVRRSLISGEKLRVGKRRSLSNHKKGDHNFTWTY